VPVVFLDLSREHYGDYLGKAQAFYRSDEFPALMLTWPDREGVFPWAGNAPDWLKDRQPALWSAAPTP
jgi:hypothetical protein